MVCQALTLIFNQRGIKCVAVVILDIVHWGVTIELLSVYSTSSTTMRNWIETQIVNKFILSTLMMKRSLCEGCKRILLSW